MQMQFKINFTNDNFRTSKVNYYMDSDQALLANVVKRKENSIKYRER